MNFIFSFLLPPAANFLSTAKESLIKKAALAEGF